jgi:hypothetical protein
MAFASEADGIAGAAIELANDGQAIVSSAIGASLADSMWVQNFGRTSGHVSDRERVARGSTACAALWRDTPPMTPHMAHPLRSRAVNP